MEENNKDAYLKEHYKADHILLKETTEFSGPVFHKNNMVCPICGSYDITKYYRSRKRHYSYKVKCNDCNWVGKFDDLLDMDKTIENIINLHNYRKDYIIIGMNALSNFLYDKKHFVKTEKYRINSEKEYLNISNKDNRQLVFIGWWNPKVTLPIKKLLTKANNITKKFKSWLVDTVDVYMLKDEWELWKLQNPRKWENWIGYLELSDDEFCRSIDEINEYVDDRKYLKSTSEYTMIRAFTTNYTNIIKDAFANKKHIFYTWEDKFKEGIWYECKYDDYSLLDALIEYPGIYTIKIMNDGK